LVREGGTWEELSEVEEQAPLYALLPQAAIRLLSDNDPSLRKACMVAARPPSSSNFCETTVFNSIRSSHRSSFVEILNKINNTCNLKEVLRSINLAIEGKVD
jgi:lysine-specific demethylase/histidyl-hydroxylase NO66